MNSSTRQQNNSCEREYENMKQTCSSRGLTGDKLEKCVSHMKDYCGTLQQQDVHKMSVMLERMQSQQSQSGGRASGNSVVRMGSTT